MANTKPTPRLKKLTRDELLNELIELYLYVLDLYNMLQPIMDIEIERRNQKIYRMDNDKEFFERELRRRNRRR